MAHLSDPIHSGPLCLKWTYVAKKITEFWVQSQVLSGPPKHHWVSMVQEQTEKNNLQRKIDSGALALHSAELGLVQYPIWPP